MTINATDWTAIIPLIVRALINDLSTPYTYDEERLQQLIVTCAQLVKLEIDFNLTYTIDIPNMSISPDPASSNDDGFINLISMKTACLVLQGELKNLATGNVRVQDGPSSIDMTGAYTATKNLYDQLCKDYDKARLAYVLGNVSELKVIFSAYQLGYNYSGPGIYFG